RGRPRVEVFRLQVDVEQDLVGASFLELTTSRGGCFVDAAADQLEQVGRLVSVDGKLHLVGRRGIPVVLDVDRIISHGSIFDVGVFDVGVLDVGILDVGI